MTEMLHPTPYTDVNAVLRDVLTNIQTLLGPHFRAMYLSGSLALGDFDPERSDIDYIVVTTGELPDDLFVALQAMHARLATSGSPWATKLDAVYIPQHVLRHPAPSGALYPQIEKGRPLVWDHLESGWPAQCALLRAQGIVMAGPDPRTLIAPVDPHALRHAAAEIAGTWQTLARDDPGWIVWLRQRENNAFVVVTLCRLLYTLDRGEVASKPAAARWAQQTLDQQCTALIADAITKQSAEHAVVSDAVIASTLALIAYTVVQCQQGDVPMLSAASPTLLPDG